MAKRKRQMDYSHFKAKEKEGRGQRDRDEYKPWLTIHDVPSKGRVTRVWSWKTERMHHLLSDLEYAYFLMLDASLNVTDIKEQYPLLPLEETLSIARELEYMHPVDTKTKFPNPLTTDFLITYNNVILARTCKYEKDLTMRVYEKLAIENVFWSRREVSWAIVTEKSIPKNRIKNLKYISKAYNIEDYGLKLDHCFLMQLAEVWIEELAKEKFVPAEIATNMDKLFKLEAGTGLLVFRHLLARNIIPADLDILIEPRKSITILSHSVNLDLVRRLNIC